MQFLFYYFVCLLTIFLIIKVSICKELVGYLVSCYKLSLSKTPRLLVYIISLIKTFINAVLLNAILLKIEKKPPIFSWRTNLRVEVSRNIRSVSYESNIFNVASRAAQTAATRMDTTGYAKSLCLLCETLYAYSIWNF